MLLLECENNPDIGASHLLCEFIPERVRADWHHNPAQALDCEVTQVKIGVVGTEDSDRGSRFDSILAQRLSQHRNPVAGLQPRDGIPNAHPLGPQRRNVRMLLCSFQQQREECIH